MTEAVTALRAALDAETDEALSRFRPGGPAARTWAAYGDAAQRAADGLREQFPGVPLARLVAAVAVALDGIRDDLGGAPSAVLLTVLGLAAAMLDGEEAGRG